VNAAGTAWGVAINGGTDIQAGTITAAAVTTEILTAAQAAIAYASVSYLTANYLTANQISATYATFLYLGAHYFTADAITANFATFSYLTANFATISQLNAHTITADKVISGTFQGLSMVLNLNGVTTTLGNQYVSQWYQYTGIGCVDNISAARGAMGSTRIGCDYASRGDSVYMQTSPAALTAANVSSSGGSTFVSSASLGAALNFATLGVNVTNVGTGASANIYMSAFGTAVSISIKGLPTSNPGTGQLWVDPTDSYRVKLGP
jgi:hypothetical protein